MAYAPRQTVTGPARVPLPYGLFSVVNLTTPNDPHWQNGVQWESTGCAPAQAIGNPSCDPAASTVGLPKDLDADNGNGVGEADPFTIYYPYVCTPIGNLAEFQNRATAGLLAREENAVEDWVWWNVLSPQSIAVSELTEVDPVFALGTLEQWIANGYGSLGMLHMTRLAATYLLRLGLLTASGSTLQTKLGTPVVVGSGYDGDGTNATTVMISPPLFGYRSEVFTSSDRVGDLLDRGNNDMHAIAERTYVIGFDPCPEYVATGDPVVVSAAPVGSIPMKIGA